MHTLTILVPFIPHVEFNENPFSSSQVTLWLQTDEWCYFNSGLEECEST
jgi:hypothetical protein